MGPLRKILGGPGPPAPPPRIDASAVNSPTGQTLQRMSAADSLKDADLRKDVPFGGLDDE